RRKTGKIEQFLIPRGPQGQRQAPPRVRFVWGELTLVGLISQLAIDFDLFAPNGVPLRAKMAVTIREQKPEYQLLQAGPGSSTQGNAPTSGGGGGGAGPGSQPRGAGNRTGTALEGESAADFAVRMGLGADAWRGVAAGLEGTLSLDAGVEIDFDATATVSAGVGVSAGFRADAGVSLEASLGLEASASISAGAELPAGASASAGFALSAAGGVDAAVETVRIASAQAAARASAQAFGATATRVSASLPTGGGTAAASGAAPGVLASPARGAASASGGGAVSASAATIAAAGAATAVRATSLDASSPSPATTATSAPSAYAPPRADPRAVSYGFGVPLRPRTGAAAQAAAGVVALRPYGRAREAPVTRDPTAAPWEQLPAASAPKPAPAGGGASPAGRRRVGCECGAKGG
ncbi:MAG TPA: hypothetical protein VEW03_07810, partial [Longimicrobiaceae bacterium]|nr:hypothetical protein [Longimicrobiaceae bacterium]